MLSPRTALSEVRSRQPTLEDVTIRDFSGGWNVIDNELNLDARYATIFDNVVRLEDGSVGVRYGTELYWNCFNLQQLYGRIVDIYFFQNRLIAVFFDGTIYSYQNGVETEIWSAAIAATLPGAPAGWAASIRVTSAIFGGKLIIVNGGDKPLEIDFDNTPNVQYLADPGTGSNANTPICGYVLAMNRYLIMAGDPLNLDRVHISARDSAGTWFGDPAPNDATFVDLGNVGIQGDNEITGINRFRNKLVVGFYEGVVLGQLGIYDDTDAHVPDFSDVLDNIGCQCHKSMISVGNDMYMLDRNGVVSLAEAVLSRAVEPRRVSELIDPVITANVSRVRRTDILLRSTAVYNANEKQYMLFMPRHAPIDVQSERTLPEDPVQIRPDDNTILWITIPNHQLAVGDAFFITMGDAFNTVPAGFFNDAALADRKVVTKVITEDIVQINAEEEGVPFTTDPLGDIIGGGALVEYEPRLEKLDVYVYTSIKELKVRAWSRYTNWRYFAACTDNENNVFLGASSQVHRLGSKLYPVYQDFQGVVEGTDGFDNVFEREQPINFVWEFPWADFDTRVNLKHTKYMQLDTYGTAGFTVSMFVDNLRQRLGDLIPALSMNFIGGDTGGFGLGPQPYGGGRNTRDERLFNWPCRGKLFKLRIEGSTDRPLRIVAISLLYHDGSIRR